MAESNTKPRRRWRKALLGLGVVLDVQLDNCDLTFSDLERIQEAFLRLLVSTYHHRVDYPGFDFRSPKADKGQGGESQNRKSQRG